MAIPPMDSSDPNELPWRKRYSFVLIVLMLISIVTVSLKRSLVAPGDWSAEVPIGVSAITLTLLLLLVTPVIVPWLIQPAPRLRAFFLWKRGAIIDEVEIAGFHLEWASLANSVAEAAEKYEAKVLKVDARVATTIQSPEGITAAYIQLLEQIKTSTKVLVVKPSGASINCVKCTKPCD